MPQYLSIIFSISLSVITVIFLVVGVYILTVLSEVKRTLTNLNNTMEKMDYRFNQLVTPLTKLGGMASGIKSGMKIFESFVNWLNRNKE